MVHENIIIRMLGASLYYRRVFSAQNMSVDDIRILLEGGAQLLLEYLSPGWVGFTLFLLSLPIPGVRVDWPDERLTEPSKKCPLRTFYPEFIRTNTIIFILNHFYPNKFLFIFLDLICCVFLFGNAQGSSPTGPNLGVRENV